MASVIGCCAVHTPQSFCFSCLQDAVPRTLTPAFVNSLVLDRHGRWASTFLQRNWDTTSFDRDAKTLCHSCRYDTLSKTIMNELNGQSALKRALDTLQCHRVIHDFNVGGQGNVETVIALISEQFWLSDQDTFYQEAIVNKYHTERDRRLTRYGQISPEDDAEAVRLATNLKFLSSLRNETLAKWAHDRIMSGIWIAPFDTLHESFPALEHLMEDARDNHTIVLHPYQELVPKNPPSPPSIPPCHSEQLWEDLATAFEQQFRRLLREPLINCLNR